MVGTYAAGFQGIAQLKYCNSTFSVYVPKKIKMCFKKYIKNTSSTTTCKCKQLLGLNHIQTLEVHFYLTSYLQIELSSIHAPW